MNTRFKSNWCMNIWSFSIILSYLIALITLILPTSNIIKIFLVMHILNFSIFLFLRNNTNLMSKSRNKIIKINHEILRILCILSLFSNNKYVIYNSLSVLLSVQVSWLLFNYKCKMIVDLDNSSVEGHRIIKTYLFTVLQVIKLILIN